MEQEILAILKSIQQDMQEIQSDIKIIRSDITEIQSDVTDIKFDVDTIKSNLTDIDKSLNKIKGHQDTLCLASTTILDKIQSTSSLQALEEIVKQNCYDIACLKAKSKNF